MKKQEKTSWEEEYEKLFDERFGVHSHIGARLKIEDFIRKEKAQSRLEGRREVLEKIKEIILSNDVWRVAVEEIDKLL